MEPQGASILNKGFQIVTREGGGGETGFETKKKTKIQPSLIVGFLSHS
jgi:hypothetical protein